MHNQSIFDSSGDWLTRIQLSLLWTNAARPCFLLKDEPENEVWYHQPTAGPTWHNGSLGVTGVARNFDWGGPTIETFCDVILMTFFSDVMAITSLKW